MGNVIPRSAAAERIIDSVGKTLTNATARGGQVQALAEARLSGLYTAAITIDREFAQVSNASDGLHAVLMARDSESDLEIGAVADEIWNTLGRPGQSVDYNLIMGSGKSAWTDGDPVQQPHLMKVLAKNIRQSSNALLADKKESWAVRIEQRAEAQDKAAAPIEATDAQVIGLKMQRRALANSVQVELTRLKRDYKNAGLTEAQIHEIIPDVPVASSAKPSTQPPAARQPASSAATVTTAQPATPTETGIEGK